MASTQKKGNSRKKTPAPPPPPAYNAAARVAGGIVCALLALCVLVSYFNVDALLLVWIARVLKGTLGGGRRSWRAEGPCRRARCPAGCRYWGACGPWQAFLPGREQRWG